MNPGKLSHKVEVQSKTPTYNSYNEPIDTWATSFSVWVEIITTGGGEFYAAQKLSASTTAVIRARYNAAVVVTQRIKYGSRVFEILNINDVNMAHKELLISVKEVV